MVLGIEEPRSFSSQLPTAGCRPMAPLVLTTRWLSSFSWSSPAEARQPVRFQPRPAPLVAGTSRSSWCDRAMWSLGRSPAPAPGKVLALGDVGGTWNSWSEEVREDRSCPPSVPTADVVPEVHPPRRRAVVARQDHAHAVRQPVAIDRITGTTADLLRFDEKRRRLPRGRARHDSGDCDKPVLWFVTWASALDILLTVNPAIGSRLRTTCDRLSSRSEEDTGAQAAHATTQAQRTRHRRQ